MWHQTHLALKLIFPLRFKVGCVWQPVTCAYKSLSRWSHTLTPARSHVHECLTEMTRPDGSVGRNIRAWHLARSAGELKARDQKDWSAATGHISGRGNTGTPCDSRAPPLLISGRHSTSGIFLRANVSMEQPERISFSHSRADSSLSHLNHPRPHTSVCLGREDQGLCIQLKATGVCEEDRNSPWKLARAPSC